MAKIGVEVEGKYRGLEIKTYFCDAKEYLTDQDLWRKLLQNGVGMIYISDHENIIDLNLLDLAFRSSNLRVTVELTELKEPAPIGIEIFWNASKASYEQGGSLRHLRACDQIKVEHEKYVMAVQVKNVIVTYPSDFSGDIEV